MEQITMEVNIPSEINLVTTKNKIQVSSLSTGLDESNLSDEVTYEEGQFDYALSVDGTYCIITGPGSIKSKNIKIPRNIEGLPVKSIARYAFQNANLTSVEIPVTVTEIEQEAFYGNLTLTNVTIEDATDMYIFFYNNFKTGIPRCYWWKEGTSDSTDLGEPMTLLEDNIYYAIIPIDVEGIRFAATDGNNIEQTTEITDHITEGKCWTCSEPITDNNYDVVLHYYSMPEQFKRGLTIGINAFYLCNNLYKVVMPTRLITIEAAAFYHSGIAEIDFPRNCWLTSIAERVFEGSIINEMRLPRNLEYIATRAFYESNINKVYFYSKCSVDDAAFMGCSYLESVGNSAAISRLGEGAFCDCKSLLSFTFGDKINYIGGVSFSGTGLTKAIFNDRYGWFYTEGYEQGDGTTGTAFNPYDLLDHDNIAPSYLKSSYSQYTWYKIDKMPVPTVEIVGDMLYITDPTGLATSFNVYVDGALSTTLTPSASGSGVSEISEGTNTEI